MGTEDPTQPATEASPNPTLSGCSPCSLGTVALCYSVSANSSLPSEHKSCLLRTYTPCFCAASSRCISSLLDHCPMQELWPHAASETQEAMASSTSLLELQTQIQLRSEEHRAWKSVFKQASAKGLRLKTRGIGFAD